MPELPEVEMYRRYFEETALQQKINNIEIHHPKVLGAQHEDFCTLLVGDSFRGTQRWGKTLFHSTVKNKIVYMHFGMTGSLEYYNRSLDAPKYSRVVFNFENGFNLAYVSKRMFGRLGIALDVQNYVTNKSLGKDSLEISEEQFTTALAKKNKNIKAALLDQSVCAGVGNWIADEILYHTLVYPTSPVKNLTFEQLQDIFAKMREIMEVAIEVDAIRDELPPHYITRYGRKTSIDCPRCKNVIDKIEVGGRGTYACSSCQVVY